MNAARSQQIRAVRSRGGPSDEDLKGLIWPIVKRLPAYVRLAWALVREPAIERRHKTLLYTTVVYAVTPINLMMSSVPVVGQIDNVALLLLGIRQAAAHCPPEVMARHLTRLRLGKRQLDQDLRVTLYVAWHALGRIGRPLKRNLRFAGRVAGGFSRRMIGRMIGQETKSRENTGHGSSQTLAG